MGGVNSVIAAAVCSALLNGYLACRGAHRHKLLRNYLRVLHRLSVKCNRSLFCIYYSALYNLAVGVNGYRLKKLNRLRRLNVLYNTL